MSVMYSLQIIQNISNVFRAALRLLPRRGAHDAFSNPLVGWGGDTPRFFFGGGGMPPNIFYRTVPTPI